VNATPALDRAQFRDGVFTTWMRGLGVVPPPLERLAYAQFETHLTVLDRPADVAALEGVMAAERFHLRYVDAELERLQRGAQCDAVTAAVDVARARFAGFQARRRAETQQAIERLLG
jgi:hypothetical protein